jgi:hypothetical protein
VRRLEARGLDVKVTPSGAFLQIRWPTRATSSSPRARGT